MTMKFIFKLNEYPFDEMNKRERDNLVNALRDELAKLTWREIAWTVWGNVCISLMVKDEFYFFRIIEIDNHLILLEYDGTAS
jgi:hypothetical protein